MTTLPAVAVGKAQRLVGAVREFDADTVRSLLVYSTRDDLYAVTVTLAAMVDADSSPSQLLWWNDRLDPTAPAPKKSLSPHGTHSAFNRHRANGEYPCPSCWEGERTYQRERGRRRRSAIHEVTALEDAEEGAA